MALMKTIIARKNLLLRKYIPLCQNNMAKGFKYFLLSFILKSHNFFKKFIPLPDGLLQIHSWKELTFQHLIKI